ncbi:MAG TPA: hypothetical protein VGN86_11520, partial [Pyrinomonadaceae bacterium]|nr:hypothetical protein [Pyrinomonadaceae bacterium]
FEPVDAVHPRALDRRLAFFRHAERGEKSDSGCKVVDDDTHVVQFLDHHVTTRAAAERNSSHLRFSGHKFPSAKAAAILDCNTRESEIGNAHFPFRQHDIDVFDDCHVCLDSKIVPILCIHGIL